MLDAPLISGQRSTNDERPENDAVARFSEWADLFSEGLFVILRVYVDESGTNDFTGQERGSLAPTVCGLIDTPQYWTGFCRKWKKVLNAYRAPYFHFREFASKKLCAETTSPYFGWSEKKRSGFLYDLALQASESAIPTGGSSNAKRHYEAGSQVNPFENAIEMFFSDLMVKINRHWPNYAGKILIVYDRCQDERILAPIHKVHSIFAQADARIGGLTFEDDKDPMHLPLQAADLLSYSFRQQAERVWKNESNELPELRTLDLILYRNTDRKLKHLGNADWKIFIQRVHADEKRQTDVWKKEGNPSKKYYPDLHFPFEKYGYTTTKRNAV